MELGGCFTTSRTWELISTEYGVLYCPLILSIQILLFHSISFLIEDIVVI